MSFFSTLNLTKAYWQVPVGLRSRAKMVITTLFHCFEFTVMPFGIKNAGSTFQRLIDTIMDGLTYIHCYMDNISIFSRNLVDHEDAVRTVLDRLRKNELVYNPQKSKFFQSTIDFLGHHITKDDITPIKQNKPGFPTSPLPQTRHP